MSSGALAHRSVASIRAAPPQGPAPPSPHTPPSRVASSSYGSPSTMRADDDFVLIELGSRFVRVGFAGDALPKVTLSCGPEQARRVGDYRAWQQPPPLPPAGAWSGDYELWRRDLRSVDLGLFHDKLDRLLRDAFTTHLLIDSRPRRMGLILDPQAPAPLLSTVLDTLFSNFQTPVVSLMSSPTMCAVAAGVRSALVIDMGWAETVVTSVYEYREMKTTRTVRGGRLLLDGLHALLRRLLLGERAGGDDDDEAKVVSFEECEDVLCRLVWCRASACKSAQRQSAQLDTVEEQDESDAESRHRPGATEVPLRSASPPSTLSVPLEKLADVCDDSLFGRAASAASAFDDDELPLHLLVYQHLLRLPVDARAVCMARIMFTGGCSNILGVKERIVDELTSLVERRGWEPATGKGVEQLRSKQRLKQASTQRSSVSSTANSESSSGGGGGGGDDDGGLGARAEAPGLAPAGDIEAKIARNRRAALQLRGQLRALHTLGAWAGASLLFQLKMPALATIERDQWMQQGPNGACRPSEVDVKAQQRQSVGAGGLMRGSGGQHTNWTLGIWGPY